MIDAGAVVLDVIPDTRDFGRRVQSDLTRGKSTGKLRGAGAAMGRKLLAGVGAVFAGQQIVSFFADAVEGASDLEESTSKVRQVFKGAAPEVEAFASTAARGLGQSKQQALEAAGSFGNLLTAMGLARPEAANMSTEMVTLATDLASFNNVPIEEALESLRSGLVGETEPMRRFGVAINAAEVEAKALELGLADANGEIGEGAKVQARAALIMEQTATAQGDFARTSGGLANQQKILSAQWTDLKTRLGSALLPVITRVVTFMNNSVIPALLDAGQGANRLSERLAPVGAVLSRVVRVFTSAGPKLGKGGPVGTAIADVGALVGQVMPRIQKIVSKAMAVVREVVTAAVKFVRGVWARGGRDILRNLGVVWKSVKTIITSALDAVMAQLDLVLAVFRGDWSAAWTAVKKITSSAAKALGATIKGLFALGRALFRAGTSVLQTLWSGAWTRIRKSASSAMGAIGDLIRRWIDTQKRRWSGFVDDLKRRWNNGLDAVRKAAGSVRDALGNIFNQIKGRIATPINWVIRTVINNGIIRAWNRLVGALGFGNLKVGNVPTISYNSGGVVRGRPGLQEYNLGGRVPGMGTSDTVPALLTPGEFVLRRAAVRWVGVKTLESLNRHGKVPPTGGDPQRFAAGGMARAVRFAKNQHGKPYIWGGVGPRGYDCSGFMSAILNVLQGKPAHVRRFATANIAAVASSVGLKSGLGPRGGFSIGSRVGSPGHMAGTLGGVNVESGGYPSRVKYRVGADGATRPGFTRHFHADGAGGYGALIKKLLSGVVNRILGGVQSTISGRLSGVFGGLARGLLGRVRDIIFDKAGLEKTAEKQAGSGFYGTVTGPTRILAGERGREDVLIWPHARGGLDLRAGGGGSSLEGATLMIDAPGLPHAIQGVVRRVIVDDARRTDHRVKAG